MQLPTLHASFFIFFLLHSVCSLPSTQWPNGPFSTSGRWIVNSEHDNVTYAGVNWPGHLEAMVPEGLQFSSIKDIVAKIKSLGMNVIRLTYAIEMIDEIYANNGVDIDLLTTFTTALGKENGTMIYEAVLKHNPQFHAHTTRLEVRFRRLFLQSWWNYGT